MSDNKEIILKEFMQIPGVGKKTSEDFWELGLRSIEDLNGKDPEELYARLCLIEGKEIDRCMLYVIRTAVYYASNKNHDPNLLKWWNWKYIK
ncbi:MAG: pathogenicity locus [Candidatus Methanofastidiosa archaeon]|jgi:hypothetical protein|nr:pathogenicity locus [Candidatus Methanofastidiosa archaeon]